MTFGTGKPLRQLLPILRDAKKRKLLILDRVERDSVIEGLPRFNAEIRTACSQEIDTISA